MNGDDRVMRIVYRIAHAIVLTPFKAIFRVRIHGRERVPKSGAFVVAPSHRSLMDIFFTAYITPRRIRFMAKQELFEKRFLAWLFAAFGGFAVERGTADRGALRAARRALEGGEPVVIFPEGTRGHGPEIGALFDGAAYLAARLGLPVVPVAIGGSEEILASGKVLPRPRRVGIVVGEPILPPLEHDGRVRRQEVAQMTEQLRTELQKRFDDALALARVRPR